MNVMYDLFVKTCARNEMKNPDKKLMLSSNKFNLEFFLFA